jgi:HEAT repeat protein
MEQVINQLDREEPDYLQAARLGEEALPHLIALIQGSDLGLAVKAASLAGIINADQSPTALKMAAGHAQPVVRVAAAAAAFHLAPAAASEVLIKLLDDSDVGVRKLALKSVPEDATPLLRAKIQELTTSDPENFVRTLSSEVFSRLKFNP